jgi:plastocyanin
MRVISSILGALALTVLTAGCGGSSSSTAPTPTPTPTPTPAAGTISIVGERGNQSFNPNPSPMPANHQLTWMNNDNSLIHRIVADDGSFDTGNLSPGQSSTAITLPAAGKTYHCSIHPSMVGTVSAGN